MTEYHKIQTVFKRDPATKHKNLLVGKYTLPEFEFLKDSEWAYTEKVDGTNIRVQIGGGGIVFGGRTDRAQIPSKLFGRLSERFLPLSEKLNNMFSRGACLYGEGYGAKIQKGGGFFFDTAADVVVAIVDALCALYSSDGEFY